MLSGLIREYNKIFPVLLIMAVLGTPLLTIPDIRLSGRVMFEVVVTVATAVFIIKRVNLWWGLFFALSFVSALHPFNTKDSIDAFRYVFLGALWYSVLVLTVKDVKWLLHGIRIICFVNVFWLGLQFFDLDPLTEPTKLWEGSVLKVGLLSNQNEVSALIAFCGAAFLYGRWKYLLPIVLLGLTLAMTLGGTLSFFIGIIFYIIATNPLSRFWSRGELTMILSMLFVFAIFSYMFINKPSFRRSEAWSNGMGFYKTRWITGYSIGHWKIIFGKMYEKGILDSWWLYAHNEFIQGLVEMGIGFAIAVVGYCVDIVRKFTRAAIEPTTAIIIIIVNCMINFPFHIAQTAIIAITWMAILQITLMNNPKIKHEHLWIRRYFDNRLTECS